MQQVGYTRKKLWNKRAPRLRALSLPCAVGLQSLLLPKARLPTSVLKEDSMPRLCKLFVVVPVLWFLLVLSSCGSAHSDDEYYVLVSVNIQVPYWKAAGAGFSQAASQLKVKADFLGPDEFDPKAEKEAFDKAISKKATGILVSAADAKLLKASIDGAIAAGIPVITV